MNDLLLKISHSDFTLSIVGPLPKRGSFALSKIDSTSFESVRYPALKKAVNDRYAHAFLLIESLFPEFADGIQIEYHSLDREGRPLPIFFEHIDYTVLFDFNNAKKFKFWHQSEALIDGLIPFGDNIITGTINFRNNVGDSVFFIRRNNINVLKLSFVVYSTKLDLFEQRRVMMEEVQEVHNSILYELFKPTNDRATTSTERITGIEWVTLFSQGVDSLLKLVKRIENKAHSKLNTRIEFKSVSKLKASNTHYIKQVNKHGEDLLKKDNKIWSSRKFISSDTAENRYVKFLLHQVVRTGKKWLLSIETKDNRWASQIKDSGYYRALRSNLIALERILKNSFWDSITMVDNVLENKANFGFHHEFIKTEHFARKLKRGIAYDMKGSERIYVLSMDKLYELWTYIKISRLIGMLTQHNEHEIKLRTKDTQFETILSTGKSSSVLVTKHISIETNRLFTRESFPYRVPLVNQKPDIILELKNRQQLVLFDAKYRTTIVITNSDGKHEPLSYRDLITRNIEGAELCILPNDDDINVIHRYKDAIYVNRAGEYQHAVLKGYILFPGNISPSSLDKSKTAARNFGVAYLPLTPGIRDFDWIAGEGFDFLRTSELTRQKEDIRAVAEALAEIILR